MTEKYEKYLDRIAKSFDELVKVQKRELKILEDSHRLAVHNYELNVKAKAEAEELNKKNSGAGRSGGEGDGRMVTIEPKEIDVKLNLVGLNVYEEQITRINQKLEKANSLTDESAKKDPDASIEILVDRLKEKILGKDEFEVAKILTPLFGCINGEVILKMIDSYLRG